MLEHVLFLGQVRPGPHVFFQLSKLIVRNKGHGAAQRTLLNDQAQLLHIAELARRDGHHLVAEARDVCEHPLVAQLHQRLPHG